ncbi:MAG: hypothetical protein RI910_2107, partial [Verrucomicrobiota bacterium]
RLLNGYTPKGYRGFESHPLRHFTKPLIIRGLSFLLGPKRAERYQKRYQNLPEFVRVSRPLESRDLRRSRRLLRVSLIKPQVSSHPKSLAPRLSALPACAPGGDDLDFRWIQDAGQALRVFNYEIAREIFLVADAMLVKHPHERAQFRDDVATGKPFEGLFFPPGYPNQSYALLSDSIGRARLARFDLPPAVKLRGRFPPTKGDAAQARGALGIRRIAETYDQHEAEHGPDAIYELSISKVEQFGLKQAVKDFERWAEASGWFLNKHPGGRPVSVLLHLAYFRFTKGPKGAMSHRALFASRIKESQSCRNPAKTSEYGAALVAPALIKSGPSAAAWSEGVNKIGRIVIPAADALVGRYLKKP